jgi:putative tricarboxylic transport membrane protein
MNFYDLLGGFFWLVLSVFVCVESIRDGIGTVHYPGPGFLPFWSAVILGVFASILIVKNSSKLTLRKGCVELPRGMKWNNKTILVICSLFLYALVLSVAGYLIGTMALMTFLFNLPKRSKMWIQGMSALVITLLSYVIFQCFLGIRLPIGIFGF